MEAMCRGRDGMIVSLLGREPSCHVQCLQYKPSFMSPLHLLGRFPPVWQRLRQLKPASISEPWLEASHVLHQGEQGSMPQPPRLSSVWVGTTSVLACVSAPLRCASSHCIGTPVVERRPGVLVPVAKMPPVLLHGGSGRALHCSTPPQGPRTCSTCLKVFEPASHFLPPARCQGCPVSEISNEGVQVDPPCVPVPELLRGPQPSDFPCGFKFPEPLGQPPGKVLSGFLLLLASKFPALLLPAPRTV
ncbi:hypothetical protein CRENBAI_026846 [Crenichthys baileyi]|uniref:Uncharacterized protein n=1 Tax=Crenichthys baileyi TaxID=28760 RepID=A0AAV9SFR8_9TELE